MLQSHRNQSNDLRTEYTKFVDLFAMLQEQTFSENMLFEKLIIMIDKDNFQSSSYIRE